MFAIVRLGNQQFKVKAGDFIRTPFQNLSPEDCIELPVVAFGSETDFVFDSSQLKKSKVKAVVVRQFLARKVLVFKKKRRKGYRRTQGHRQKITGLRVVELKSPNGQVSKVEFKKPSVSTATSAKTQDIKTKKDSALAKKTTPKTVPKKASTIKNSISKTKAGTKKASHKKVKKQAAQSDRKKAKTTKTRTKIKTVQKGKKKS